MMNTAVFDQHLAVQQIGDGSSNTVLMAEGYAMCGGGTSTSTGTSYNYNYSYRYGWYNASYNYTYSLVYMYTSGSFTENETETLSYYTPRFSPVASKTFQTRPAPSNCDGSVPNSFSSGALQVLLGDASVRGVTNGVSPQTWNAALTPNGGEVLGSDW